MDWQKLDLDLADLDRNLIGYYRSINHYGRSLEQKVGHDGYTQEDLVHDVKLFIRQQEPNNPRVALGTLYNTSVTLYPLITADERDTMRKIFKKYPEAGCGGMLTFIMQCVECLESPADEDVFRIGLIGLSLNNFHPDFRDTGAVWAELAIAAVRTSINMEPHCLEIAELSADDSPMSMKKSLATFHLYAPQAQRLFDDDFMSYWEGMV
jgi:hypothetical protein